MIVKQAIAKRHSKSESASRWRYAVINCKAFEMIEREARHNAWPAERGLSLYVTVDDSVKYYLLSGKQKNKTIYYQFQV